MNIGVSGASGHLGSATVRELKARLGDKANIVAISRTSTRSRALGAERRKDTSTRPRTPTRPRGSTSWCRSARLHEVRRAVEADPHPPSTGPSRPAFSAHHVYLSAAGTRRSVEPPHLMGVVLRSRASSHALAPRQWSILRMAFYAESFLDRAKMSLAQGVFASSSSAPVNFVSRGDVAAAAAGLIATEGHHGAIYNATGPETLDGPARAAVAGGRNCKLFAPRAGAARATSCRAEGRGAPAHRPRRLREHRERGQAFDITTGDVARPQGRPRRLVDVANDYRDEVTPGRPSHAVMRPRRAKRDAHC